MVAHQVLHVALRHTAREQALRERLGSVDSELYCLCADAIVNASLKPLQWLELPPGSVMLDALLQQVLGIEESVDVSLHHWSTENLYQAIDDRHWQGSSSRQSGSRSQNSASTSTHSENSNSTQQSRSSRSQHRQVETGQTNKSNGQNSGNRATSDEAIQASEAQMRTPEAFDGPRSEAARQMAASIIQDLLTNFHGSPEQQEEDRRQWSERLLRAHTADGEQSLMRQLLADNQTLKTPWEQLLRTQLQRALAQKTHLSWSRASRSWLANRGRTASGKRMPWQPGTSSSKSCARLCVMVDVSGSVDTPLLNRFSNEIERILRIHRSDVFLLVGDSIVSYQCKLRAGYQTLRDVEFHGGGGTNFAPLIDAADKLHPDFGVFLTDLDGSAGAEPDWPIIWAIPESASFRPAPFGKRLVLE
jgi:predicted metal-dependent peptidase